MTDLLQMTQDDIDRFMSFVDKLPNGCWFWAGARSKGKGNRKWYGSFHFTERLADGTKRKRVVRAHRVATEVLKQPPEPCPPGSHRDHTCVFSLCVNPDHIETISKEENHERKLARARQRAETELAKLVCLSPEAGGDNHADGSDQSDNQGGMPLVGARPEAG